MSIHITSTNSSEAPEQEDPRANDELEKFLKPRILAAKKGEFSDKTVDDIFDEATQDETNK